MKASVLARHPFFVQVTAESHRLQKSQEAAGVDPESDLIDEYSFYVYRVGHALAHLISWAEQLEESLAYLSYYHYGTKSEEGKLTRAKHVLYTVENYLIRLQSINDRCLQLINCVFHLCIESSSVGHSIIVSNLKVSRTEIPALLKQVRKLVEPKAQDRHTIVHKHSYQERSIDRLQLFYLFDEASWSQTERRATFRDLEHMRKDLLRRTIAEKKKEFSSLNADLMKKLHSLLDGLQQQYEKVGKQISTYA